MDTTDNPVMNISATFENTYSIYIDTKSLQNRTLTDVKDEVNDMEIYNLAK